MKVVFITSTFDHYHVSLCEEAYRQLGSDFTFISTEPMPDSMKKLGFTDFSQTLPYVLNSFESREAKDNAQKLCDEADAVIIGVADEHYIENRLGEGKLTFRFTERLFKKGFKSFFKPKNFFTLYNQHIKNRNNKGYFILCTGSYAAQDFIRIGMKREQLLKWAYFSAVKDLNRSFDNDEVNIIWTGRFVDIKHPEFALHTALRLKNENLKFKMNFIGMGPMREFMQKYIEDNDLQNEVEILGSMPTEEVQKNMAKADISLFTSDRREGWGAVVNEAMTNGCAVVASDAAGSSKILIKDGENGYIFTFPDENELQKKVIALVKDKKLRKKIGTNANKTLSDEWNGTVAMQRLLDICRNIINKKTRSNYTSGPCSNA